MEYLALIAATSLMVGMLICLELGRRYGLRQLAAEADAAAGGKRIVEASFLGLLSLLIAFSFSGAVSRFDARRSMILEEANVLWTAYMRIDLLSPDAQPRMRELFREYIDARLSVEGSLPDYEAARRELDHSTAVQSQIWSLAMEVTRGPGSHPNAGMLILNSVASMIEISTKRNWTALSHPPTIIFVLLFTVALICAFIAGNSLATTDSKPWTHVIGFALVTCVSVYVIFEIEFPRVGFVNVEKYDRALEEVRARMK